MGIYSLVLPQTPASILGDRLIINPANVKQASDYIKRNGIKSITINPAYYKVDDLSFLEDFLFIEGIYILQDKLDLSYLNRLTHLKVLSFNETNVDIDLDNFPDLEVLGITYNKRILNIGSCKKLFWLWLESYKKNDAEELSTLSELQYLNLHKTTIANLSGINKLSKLTNLKIDSASKLETLDGIAGTNTALKVLDIHNAKNLHDYSALGNAKSIQEVFFSKTGEAADITFLQTLKELKKVSIGMKITDGNMLYLKQIPKAGFLDFPHYNLKRKDLPPVNWGA